MLIIYFIKITKQIGIKISLIINITNIDNKSQ